MRVLVAEDDKVQNHLLKKHLTSQGIEVCAAFNAEEAWRMMEKNSVDVILLDLLMPGGTGLGLLKKLQESPSFREIPVIVITGSQDPLVLRMAEQYRPEAVLHKPVNFLMLDATLACCRRAAAEQPREAPRALDSSKG